MKLALDMSILIAFSKAIPHGKRCLDREGAVQTAPCVEKCHFEMSWFGLRCIGLGIPHKLASRLPFRSWPRP